MLQTRRDRLTERNSLEASIVITVVRNIIQGDDKFRKKKRSSMKKLWMVGDKEMKGEEVFEKIILDGIVRHK